MVLEEQNQRCSNSSGGGGGRLSKKLKQKKIPQRGLGVAQLEKIRLEEQQKKDGAAASVAVSSSFFVAPVSHQSSSSSIPFPTLNPINLSSSNSLFRLDPSIPNLDPFAPPPLLPTSTPKTLYDHTMLNSCEFNHGGEGSKLDPGFANRPHLPNYSNPISIPPVVVQVKQYQQQPSSMVNVSSTSTSSGFNFQMEPPSNQSNSSNYSTPLWPGEEKMVGIKRPWSFSPDNPPDPSYKFLPFIPPVCRLDESSSCGNGGTFRFEPERAIFREGPSFPALHVEWRGGMSKVNPENGAKGNGGLDGNFLTLGCPASNCSSSSSTSRSEQHSAFPACHYGDLPKFHLLPFQQGSIEDPLLQTGPVGSALQLPFYSFLPPNGQIGQEPTNLSDVDRRGEAGDSVDLNLKL